MIIRDLEKIDSQTHLSKIRLKNENEHKKRLEEIYEKLPEYKELEDSISTIAFNEVRKRLNKNKQDYSTDYEYWTKDRVKIVEKNLENFIHKEVNPDEELNFDLEMIVEYILFEMDMYSRYLKNECPCCGCCL